MGHRGRRRCVAGAVLVGALVVLACLVVWWESHGHSAWVAVSLGPHGLSLSYEAGGFFVFLAEGQSVWGWGRVDLTDTMMMRDFFDFDTFLGFGGVWRDPLWSPHQPISVARVPIWFPALLGAGLVAGGVIVWRRRRIAPGHCPACGYDLRGNPDAAVCPECGCELSPAA